MQASDQGVCTTSKGISIQCSQCAISTPRHSHGHHLFQLPFPSFLSLFTQHGADIKRKNRDNLLPLDMVKDQDSDLADLFKGDSAILDAAKKGDLDRVGVICV